LAWSGRSIGRALQHAEQIAETHQAHLPLALVEGRLHAEQVPVLSGFASVQYMRPNARSGQLDHRSMEWRSPTDEAVGVEELWKTAASNDRTTPGIRSGAAHTCSRDLMSDFCSRCGSKQLNFLVLHGPNGDGRALASDLQEVRPATPLAFGEHSES